MSFNIFIGEGCFVTDDEGNERMIVDRVTRAQAPTFSDDQLTGNSNNRHASYSAWTQFCQQTGLYTLFLDIGGLMYSQGNTRALVQRDLKEVQKALKCWKKAHPRATPGFCQGQDALLARLIWLEWWMDWALHQCYFPSIYTA